MVEPLPPASNAGLRILLSKDRPSPSPTPTAGSTVSSHTDRDRIIGVFRSALSRNEPPETFALKTVQEAIKPQLEASTDQQLDQHLPLFNLPSKILCKVVNVELRAETDSDEVYAQIMLQPEADIGI